MNNLYYGQCSKDIDRGRRSSLKNNWCCQWQFGWSMKGEQVGRSNNEWLCWKKQSIFSNNGCIVRCSFCWYYSRCQSSNRCICWKSSAVGKGWPNHKKYRSIIGWFIIWWSRNSSKIIWRWIAEHNRYKWRIGQRKLCWALTDHQRPNRSHRLLLGDHQMTRQV